ncbi:MAG: ATPase [Magnetococcales bacterium]|nr:ATPase [Magnetococcales bacterium]MBF0113889.1 ATPase [Magnetococcales bacterium]
MESTPTRSALLQARDERQVMGEGFRFLDEKRLLLAAEMARQFERYRQERELWLQQQQEAGSALQHSLLRHGLHGLQVLPAASAPPPLQCAQRRFFGVTLQEIPDALTGLQAFSAVETLSPEARLCQHRFGQLLLCSAVLAARSGNLHRLLAEYKRTERRARALEDVLLPELDSLIHEMDLSLEELDQEEAVRVRLGRPAE